MLNNIESMLGYFSQIRRLYAGKLVLKYENKRLSPNEVSILIMLSSLRLISGGVVSTTFTVLVTE